MDDIYMYHVYQSGQGNTKVVFYFEGGGGGRGGNLLLWLLSG